MKVYQLRLIMGKATNYDQSGNLKNHVMTVKYAGELELENILTDQNWKKLGACEISCVGVFDTDTKEQDTKAVAAINDRIKGDVQAGTKPKTEIELLKEQIASLTEKVNNPIVLKSQAGKEITGSEEVPTTRADNEEITASIQSVEKQLRESLFTEAAELGLKPAKNVKTDILKGLIANAKVKA